MRGYIAPERYVQQQTEVSHVLKLKSSALLFIVTRALPLQQLHKGSVSVVI